ncbi:MAG: hypothetical protein NZO58_02560 [Gemmataceae bacterium]|nr:hypothetical protein [Gemmataceae bacterium]
MSDNHASIRVAAPSRLHFGFFAPLAEGSRHWPGGETAATLPVRRFGGVGLMIDQPGVEVEVRPARSWSASGPSAARALALAQKFVAGLPAAESQQAFAVDVRRCSPEHVGLGTGTQLALATAQALACATGHADWCVAELARRMDRGRRSSLGVHGFAHGGFLIDGGKIDSRALAPLLWRELLPEDWAVLLIVPKEEHGRHGAGEQAAFGQIESSAPNWRRTEVLCRLVLLSLLPALREHDVAAFGEALYEFNRLVGDLFAPFQGGCYAGPKCAARVAWLRSHGIRGAGQSSWGPTVFGLDQEARLQTAGNLLLDHELASGCEVLLCRPARTGRCVFAVQQSMDVPDSRALPGAAAEN